jgi:hypothetical protein
MSNGNLHVVRDNIPKMVLPGPSVTIKSDGTIWMSGCPLLGISDPAEIKKYAAVARRKGWVEIPQKYFTRLGDNDNGLWAGWDADYNNHSAKKAEDDLNAKKAAAEKLRVSIHLSTRGWGDYSSVEWHGDITRPDAEILAECRNALTTADDVDLAHQTDAEILAKITGAKAAWEKKAKRPEEKPETESHGPGYCYSCESYCYGDCGDYQPELTNKIMAQRYNSACAEDNYGISD